MGKNKTDKKVNRMIKKFNKELREDVFKGRFEVRQLQKARVDDMNYYLYEVRDNLHPENNKIVPWEWGESIFFMNKIWREMNDLIVYSDFWKLYWAEREAQKAQEQAAQDMANAFAQAGVEAEKMAQALTDAFQKVEE